jgi:hypothetical protein
MEKNLFDKGLEKIITFGTGAFIICGTILAPYNMALAQNNQTQINSQIEYSVSDMGSSFQSGDDPNSFIIFADNSDRSPKYHQFLQPVKNAAKNWEDWEYEDSFFPKTKIPGTDSFVRFYEDSNQSLVLEFTSDKSLVGREDEIINNASQMLVSNYPKDKNSNVPAVAQIQSRKAQYKEHPMFKSTPWGVEIPIQGINYKGKRDTRF